MENSVITQYKGYRLETIKNNDKHTTVAYINDEPILGTHSHLDTLSSHEKMTAKIDLLTKH